jgi:hypothetical protein
MENPQLRKEEPEKLDVENPEKKDTYNEESINHKSVIHVYLLLLNNLRKIAQM